MISYIFSFHVRWILLGVHATLDTMKLPRYIMLDKQVGETPLQCVEAWRAAQPPEFADAPLAYAGRLDPMASGKLLILVGDECKNQTSYHGLDKAYEFSVLLGVSSDTHDVLGRLTPVEAANIPNLESQLQAIAQTLTGDIELPYPHFSSKTVQGKPLHVWTLEGGLGEIEIPTKASTIYSFELKNIETKTREDVAAEARTKIDTIPEVTDPSKSLGNDFRRVDVRKDWEGIRTDTSLPEHFHIAHFHCIASSGTYMRTLAHLTGQKLTPATQSLAWHIHRSHIGRYDQENQSWTKEF